MEIINSTLPYVQINSTFLELILLFKAFSWDLNVSSQMWAYFFTHN